jgi:hypothetical protein
MSWSGIEPGPFWWEAIILAKSYSENQLNFFSSKYLMSVHVRV